MRTVLAIAIAVGALLLLSTSASTAQTGVKRLPAGWSPSWTWAPATCVRVWMLRSRQTRYAGAPRCRRVPV